MTKHKNKNRYQETNATEYKGRRNLSPESANKLQIILGKRLGRTLTNEELNLAYSNLMDFTYALLALESDQEERLAKPKDENILNSNKTGNKYEN